MLITKYSALVACAALVGMVGAASVRVITQERESLRPNLSGRWQLNQELSENAQAKVDRMQSSQGHGPGRHGFGRLFGSGDMEEARGLILNAPASFTLTQDGDRIVLTGSDGRVRTLIANGRKEKVNARDVQTKWDVMALCSLGAFVPSTVFAQHGPGRHDTGFARPQEDPAPQEGAPYETKTEATFTGTVTDVKTGGPGRLEWLMRVHTLGLGHKGAQEKQLLLKTATDTVRIHLGPTAFLTDQKVEIRKGDTLDVTGSRVTIGESQLVLAREIRKADNTWTLRDIAGQPLWRSAQTEARGFWTTKKVLLTVVAVKVALLFTVLRH